MKDLRYIRNADKFLGYSYSALKDHFSSREEFDKYYNAIETDIDKNRFLKTASFYLFLVKNGSWKLDDIPNSNQEIDYLTISYQFIAIVSLIESLSTSRHIDFYEFLNREKVKSISNKLELGTYYSKYKEEFGSNKKFVTFCRSLSLERQRDLVSKYTNKLPVLGKFVAPPDEDIPKHLEKLAKDLYELRSKFIHEAELPLHMLSGTSVSYRKKKLVICSLSIKDVMQVFEEGLLIHFQKEPKEQK